MIDLWAVSSRTALNKDKVGEIMKLTHIVIMFFAAILSYVCILNAKVDTLRSMGLKYVQCNNAVDSAIDAAVSQTVESASSSTELSTNFDGCVDRFYNSLYASFGALDNEILQQDLKIYTPVIALADVDGYYILYNSISSDGTLVKKKTAKLPYVMTFDKGIDGSTLHYTVNVTLGNEVTVAIQGDDTVYKGDYSALSSKYPGTKLSQVYSRTVLSRNGTFNDWKNHIIATNLCEQLNHYVKLNNTIAADFGIKYNFTLPETASTELSNGISNITFIALFQGYPYGAGLSEVYNKFCVSGAKVTKVKVYYVRPYDDGGGLHYYYHKSKCRKYLDATQDPNGFYSTNDGLGYAFSSAMEAAESGALPCPYCCY